MSRVTYFGYGLQIDSDLRLPGFLEDGEGARGSVSIKRGDLSADTWSAMNDNGMRLAGMAEDVMRFLVNEGQEIVVDPLPEADLDYARAIISGELMSALLRQQGLLTLHASCVARDGKAIGFVGYSGWGKSTLAMHFVRRGYQLICDDVLAVDFLPEGPVVVPGYPQVKLRGDSAARLVEQFERLPAAHSQTDKRLLACGSYSCETQVPLSRVYLLEGESRASNQIASLSPSRVLTELVGHTRANNLLKSKEFRSTHLRQVTALMKSVPVKRLERIKSLDLLPMTCDLIEKDVQETAGAKADLAVR